MTAVLPECRESSRRDEERWRLRDGEGKGVDAVSDMAVAEKRRGGQIFRC